MNEVKQALQAAAKAVANEPVEVELTRPDAEFGDFATNVALQLSKKLGQNPRDVAAKIVAALPKDSIIAKVDIAGPGFINVTLTDQALWGHATQQPATFLDGKTVVSEYSDPNPLKPLHAGHLYTTLVGDSISRILELAGAKVIRINYGGDVGLHVARSMWAIIKFLGGENPDKLAELAESDRPTWLGQRYVEGTSAYNDDESAKAEIVAINKRVYQLHTDHDKDSGFAQIYWTVRQWSYDYFKELYTQLQVVPFDRFLPESEVAELGLKTVRDQQKRGIYEESDGAVVFRGEQFGLHTRVFINSAGLPTYETKDVGLLLRKWEDYHFDMSLVITANEQAQYYQVMLKSVEQFNPEPVKKSRHLTHGLVKLKGGVKMSSREGNIVTALEILDAARQAAQQTGNATDETTLAAIKYSFAKNRIGGDIIYDPAESIALEGNSGPYIQYAYARARSILAKAQDTNVTIQNLDTGERSLVRKLGEYPEVFEKAANELMPHYICTYMYELAQIFNRFYEQNRVIGDEREQVRLTLVKAYAQTLLNGLTALNISAPEKM